MKKIEETPEININDVYTVLDDDQRIQKRPLFYLCPFCLQLTWALKEPHNASRCQHCCKVIPAFGGGVRMIGIWLYTIVAIFLTFKILKNTDESTQDLTRTLLIFGVPTIISFALHILLPKLFPRMLAFFVGGIRLCSIRPAWFLGVFSIATWIFVFSICTVFM